MNETESGWDEVESLVSMSDATIYSNQNDAVSIADSQDIDNDPGIVQDNEIVTQKDDDDEHDIKEGEQQQQTPRPHKQKSIEDLNSETKIPELKALSSDEQVNTTINGNINDRLSPINDIEADLRTANDIDSPEKSSGEDENLEPEELLDGGAEELPFVRSVKYLEKHEIFRLFQVFESSFFNSEVRPIFLAVLADLKHDDSEVAFAPIKTQKNGRDTVDCGSHFNVRH